MEGVAGRVSGIRDLTDNLHSMEVEELRGEITLRRAMLTRGAALLLGRLQGLPGITMMDMEDDLREKTLRR